MREVVGRVVSVYAELSEVDNLDLSEIEMFIWSWP